jgi:hypothetical protein
MALVAFVHERTSSVGSWTPSVPRWRAGGAPNWGNVMNATYHAFHGQHPCLRRKNRAIFY